MQRKVVLYKLQFGKLCFSKKKKNKWKKNKKKLLVLFDLQKNLETSTFTLLQIDFCHQVQNWFYWNNLWQSKWSTQRRKFIRMKIIVSQIDIPLSISCYQILVNFSRWIYLRLLPFHMERLNITIPYTVQVLYHLIPRIILLKTYLSITVQKPELIM